MADRQAQNENADETEVKLPLHEDIMQLARIGDIGAIQKLIDAGKYTASYEDPHPDTKGVTPLHWAAINNHFALCKYLVLAGADVNARGGDAVATPAMWAVQRCNYYVVHLLLQHGADVHLKDIQGNNMLHLATFDGNVYQALLLLHYGSPIDEPDPQGNTCLMWAAYKGYPACVDLLLDWGASVNRKDNKGLMALHWALVKGNGLCIRKLLQAGADRFAMTSEEKTPAIVAREMKTEKIWHRVLNELAFDKAANPRTAPAPISHLLKSRRFHNRFFFLTPFFSLILFFNILSTLSIVYAVPSCIILTVFLQLGAQQVLQWAPTDMKHLQRTPYLAGVFAATLFWVGFRWLTIVSWTTFHLHKISNVFFLTSYSLCAYFYILSTLEDPGYVPRIKGRTPQKAVVEEMLALWQFDEEHFCTLCAVRIPLRSKHCHRCQRCVAKHDHHCPWIHNCVGNNNQRHFFLYIVALAIGILFFLRLVYDHLLIIPPTKASSCHFLPEVACDYLLRDSLTVILAIWSFLQLIWVVMLLFTQLVLIARAQTTWESMRGNLHRVPRSAQKATAMMTSGSTTIDGAQIAGAAGPFLSSDSAQTQAGHHQQHEGYFAQLTKLLGLDMFLATASGRTRRRRNPYSRGVLSNCSDFWQDGSPYFRRRKNGAARLGGVDVNYTRMYEVPPRMTARCTRSSDEAGTYQAVDSEEVEHRDLP